MRDFREQKSHARDMLARPWQLHLKGAWAGCKQRGAPAVGRGSTLVPASRGSAEVRECAAAGSGKPNRSLEEILPRESAAETRFASEEQTKAPVRTRWTVAP